MKRPETMIREYDRNNPIYFFTLFTYIRPRKNGEATLEVWGAMRHMRRKNRPLVMKHYFTYRTDSDRYKARGVWYVDSYSPMCGPHIKYDMAPFGGENCYRYAYTRVGGKWMDLYGQWLTGSFKDQRLHPTSTTILGSFDNTKYRYCGYDERNWMNMKEYIDFWKRHPKAEIFSKMGCFQLLEDKFLDKCETDKAFAKFVFHNREYIRQHLVRASSVRESFRRKMSVPEYMKMLHDTYDERVARFIPKSERERREAERKNNEKHILALYNRIRSICGKYGAYEVVVPKTVQEMHDEGNAMHNCVGYCYASKQGKSSIVVFLHKDGKPCVDVEINPKTYDIVQCRAVCNREADKAQWRVARRVANALRSVA